MNFEHQLNEFITQRRGKVPQITLILLEDERLYNYYKNICYHYNVISQVVNQRTVARMNLSVASNVLKQMVSKIGGELYLLEFPKNLSSRTMLIGIDVCH